MFYDVLSLFFHLSRESISSPDVWQFFFGSPLGLPLWMVMFCWWRWSCFSGGVPGTLPRHQTSYGKPCDFETFPQQKIGRNEGHPNSGKRVRHASIPRRSVQSRRDPGCVFLRFKTCKEDNMLRAVAALVHRKN